MEVSAGLVAGSHNRNEIVVIRRDGEFSARPLQQLSSQICKICDDDVGLTIDGEPFVACNDCAFPVCRTCYDYERREGSQVCPQCKTRFKRLKGCPRVEGDEEEDDIDDVENEFNFESDHMKHDFQCYGFEHFELDMPSHESRNQLSQVPLLTSGQMVDNDIDPEKHALVLMGLAGFGGKRILALSYRDTNTTVSAVQPRSLDPSKDLAAYGYGSIAWKERMESWKQKQEKQQMTKDSVCEGGDEDEEFDLSVLN